MSKVIIATSEAPAAIGTYSQGVEVNGVVYLSGQIPLDPQTMELVDGLEAQAHQVFRNLAAVATAAGGSMSDFVKLTIYLTDLSNFHTVNEVMTQHFDEPYPARAAIGINEFPKGAQIEIDGILVTDA